MRFNAVTFYEGDLAWSKINTYYRDDTPRGGYFEDLTVQVRRDGQYITPDDVRITPDLSPLSIYQRITITFAPAVGDAVRIAGKAGGTDRFTTILELEASGTIYAGPEAIEVALADARTAPYQPAKLVLTFTEPVDLQIAHIRLYNLANGSPIDLLNAALLQNAPRDKALLTLDQVLPPADYVLELDCAAITNCSALPLADSDQDPTDGIRTLSFTVSPPAPTDG
jgi:hypothetical protein